MASTISGNEVVLKDGRGRLMRLSLSELVFSGRAGVICEEAGPSAGDDQEIASVILDQLHEGERRQVLERAEHVSELLTGFRSGSPELGSSRRAGRQPFTGSPRSPAMQSGDQADAGSAPAAPDRRPLHPLPQQSRRSGSDAADREGTSLATVRLALLKHDVSLRPAGSSPRASEEALSWLRDRAPGLTQRRRSRHAAARPRCLPRLRRLPRP